MCFDKSSCWDYNTGVPNYLNRSPPCQSQRMIITAFNLEDFNQCKEHQFFTIIDNAAQNRDLRFYLETFSDWSSIRGPDSFQWLSISYPEIVINGYKSLDTNMEWRYTNGTRQDGYYLIVSIYIII